MSLLLFLFTLSLSLYMVVHLYIVHMRSKSIKDMVGFYYKAKRKGHYIISTVTVYNSLSLSLYIYIYVFLVKVMFPLIFFGKSPPSKFPNFLNPKNLTKKKLCFKTSPMDFLVLNSRKMPWKNEANSIPTPTPLVPLAVCFPRSRNFSVPFSRWFMVHPGIPARRSWSWVINVQFGNLEGQLKEVTWAGHPWGVPTRHL